MKPSPLRTRIREYENAYRIHLPKRTPIIIRVDGKAFHTLTKGYDRPWDPSLVRAMNATALALCIEIQGAQIAYVQSDEITIFIRNYDKYATSPWFSNVLQKMCSVSAAIATRAFNKTINTEALEYLKPQISGEFDSRVFCVPREEVCNVFVDRQQDCIRNSILGLGQHFLGKKAVHGLSCEDIKRALNLQGSQVISKDSVSIGEGGWDHLGSWEKYGRVIIKNQAKTSPFLNEWTLLQETPVFQEDRSVIDKLVWPEDEEGAYSKPETLSKKCKLKELDPCGKEKKPNYPVKNFLLHRTPHKDSDYPAAGTTPGTWLPKREYNGPSDSNSKGWDPEAYKASTRTTRKTKKN